MLKVLLEYGPNLNAQVLHVYACIVQLGLKMRSIDSTLYESHPISCSVPVCIHVYMCTRNLFVGCGLL